MKVKKKKVSVKELPKLYHLMVSFNILLKDGHSLTQGPDYKVPLLCYPEIQWLSQWKISRVRHKRKKNTQENKFIKRLWLYAARVKAVPGKGVKW